MRNPVKPVIMSFICLALVSCQSTGDRAPAKYPKASLASGPAKFMKLDANVSNKVEEEKEIARRKRLAEEGDPEAQYVLSLMYGNGVGVEVDFDFSRHWMGRAADGGQRDAQFERGKYSLSRAGKKRDERSAAMWFRRAAEQGHAPAQHALGQFYYHGRGVGKGLVRAQYYMGEFLADGTTPLKDDLRALVWLHIAADQGNRAARNRTKQLEQRYSEEQRKEAHRRARQWLAEHPEKDPTVESRQCFTVFHCFTGTYIQAR